ncbi:MAG: COX15/CtaA family protein [Rhodobacteraceae bacterium]|nr:COX15/CtaA family protein [Paracoccaceae bacterium]
MPPRKIFEEVASRPEAERTARPASRTRLGKFDYRPLRLYLATLLLLVVAMVLLGGITRHTDSGLSITDWRPVANILPPLSQEAWQAAFDSYRQTPEFKLQNSAMTLVEFKSIYWWEWGHRLTGMLTGLVWAVGYALLHFLGKLPAGWHGRMLVLGGIGALQGVIGWWMVSSGLTGDRVDVAATRLAVHLVLALGIISLIVGFTMQTRRQPSELMQARRHQDSVLVKWSVAMVLLVFLQSAMGALLAGVDGGSAFPTWPLMNGQVFPSDALAMQPVLANFIENPNLLHFNHRLGGYILLVVATMFWWRSRHCPQPSVRDAIKWLMAFVWIQAFAGIATALVAATFAMAMLHQLLAVAVVVLATSAMFNCRFPGSAIRRSGTDGSR